MDKTESKLKKGIPLICRLCFEVTFDSDIIRLDKYNRHIILFALDHCIDFDVTEDPIVCNSCMKTTTTMYNFKHLVLQNEDSLTTFRQESNRDLQKKVDLHHLVSLSMMNLNRFCNVGAPLVPKIEPSSSFCPQEKNVNKPNTESSEILPQMPETLSMSHVDDKANISIEDVVMNWFPGQEHIGDMESKYCNSPEVSSFESGNSSKQSSISGESKYCNSPEVSSFESGNSSKQSSISGESKYCNSPEVSSFESGNSSKQSSISGESKYCNSPKVSSFESGNSSKQSSISGDAKDIHPKEQHSVFKCTQCSYESSSRLGVSKHTYKDHRGQSINCLFCAQSFKQKINLDSHLLNKHSEIDNIISFVTNRVYFCDYCTYRSVNSYNYDKHLLVKHKNILHEGEKIRKFKTYSCQHCDYTTTNCGNFSTHISRHSKVKRFKCQLCDGEYSQKYNLNVHVLKRHQNDVDEIEKFLSCKLYKCFICDFKTIERGKFTRHHTSHSDRK